MNLFSLIFNNANSETTNPDTDKKKKKMNNIFSKLFNFIIFLVFACFLLVIIYNFSPKKNTQKINLLVSSFISIFDKTYSTYNTVDTTSLKYKIFIARNKYISDSLRFCLFGVQNGYVSYLYTGLNKHLNFTLYFKEYGRYRFTKTDKQINNLNGKNIDSVNFIQTILYINDSSYILDYKNNIAYKKYADPFKTDLTNAPFFRKNKTELSNLGYKYSGEEDFLSLKCEKYISSISGSNCIYYIYKGIPLFINISYKEMNINIYATSANFDTLPTEEYFTINPLLSVISNCSN